MKKLLSAFMAILMGMIGCTQSAKYITLNNAEFSTTISDPAVQLVDVRTAAEFADGHIPGAVNLDVKRSDFGQQIARLDKQHPVAVYCRSGVRSRKAAAELAQRGYKVYNLRGGVMNWNGELTK